eukprot:m51a1_g10389 putative laminin G (959) ;mRNA; f:17661-24240
MKIDWNLKSNPDKAGITAIGLLAGKNWASSSEAEKLSSQKFEKTPRLKCPIGSIISGIRKVTNSDGTEVEAMFGHGETAMACLGIGASMCSVVADDSVMAGVHTAFEDESTGERSSLVEHTFTLEQEVRTSDEANLQPPWSDVVVIDSLSLSKTRVTVVELLHNEAYCEVRARDVDAYSGAHEGVSIKTIWAIANQDVKDTEKAIADHELARPRGSPESAEMRKWSNVLLNLTTGLEMWKSVLSEHKKLYAFNTPDIVEAKDWRSAQIACQERASKCDVAKSFIKDTVFFGGATSFSMSMSAASQYDDDAVTSSLFKSQITLKTEAKVGIVGIDTAWSAHALHVTGKETSKGTGSGLQQVAATQFTLRDANLMDKYNVKMYVNKAYGTPMFRLLSAETSCPALDNTVSRTGCSATISPTSVDNVPAQSAFEFSLIITSDTPVHEGNMYDVILDHSSNPNGLQVSINGVPLDRMPVYVGPDKPTVLTVSVRRGAKAYVYENVRINVYTGCEYDLANGNGLWREPQHAQVEFNVSFLQRCPVVQWAGPYADATEPTDVAFKVISTPAPGERPNSLVVRAKNPEYPILRFKDHRRLRAIRVMYKSPDNDNWWPAKLNRTHEAVLEEDQYGQVTATLDTTTWTAEGEYRLQIVSTCDPIPRVTDEDTRSFRSPIKRGIVDRSPPELFGQFQEPADGIYWPGDQISLRFVEDVRCNEVVPRLALSLRDTVTGRVATYDREYLQLMCSGGLMNMAFRKLPVDQLPGKRAQIWADSVSDMWGNTRNEAAVWSFVVGDFDPRVVSVCVSKVVLRDMTLDSYVRRVTGDLNSRRSTRQATLAANASANSSSSDTAASSTDPETSSTAEDGDSNTTYDADLLTRFVEAFRHDVSAVANIPASRVVVDGVQGANSSVAIADINRWVEANDTNDTNDTDDETDAALERLKALDLSTLSFSISVAAPQPPA